MEGHLGEFFGVVIAERMRTVADVPECSMQGIEFNSEYPTSEARESSEESQPLGWAFGARWILLLAVAGWGALLLILALVF
jgi:hypothetical protein